MAHEIWKFSNTFKNYLPSANSDSYLNNVSNLQFQIGY